MTKKDLIYNILKELNLPKIDFEESYISEIILPSLNLLEQYKKENHQLDFENILKIMLIILNKMHERAIRIRSPKTIVFTSAIIWHSVINKNIEGEYILQIPLKEMLGGNMGALHSLREELFIKERKFENINEFIESINKLLK